MIEIDGARALQLLEAAVATRGPNYKYTDEFADPHGNCVYVYTSADNQPVPACLIGQALTEVGVRLDDLTNLSTEICTAAGYGEDDYGDTDEGFVHEFDDNELASIGVELDAAAVAVWTVAQRAQDDDYTWGEALERARRVADELAVIV